MEAECCALAGHGLRPASLRRQASRPQLKRDPLGSVPNTRVPNTTELNLAAARLALGQARAADLKAAASAAIDAGRVTPDIAALAMLRDDALSEAEPMFRRALGELRIAIPSIDDATWLLLRSHVGAIAERATDPEQGLKDVMAVYQAADLHGKSRQYAGDSHDIQALVGFYWELDDLHDHDTEVDSSGSYGAALDELRSQVIEAARSWVAKHAA